MGMWSELHYSTREISEWIYNREPVRPSDYISLHQSPSYVMPFRSQAKCLLAFISYLLMRIFNTNTSVCISFITSHLYLTACCWFCATMVALMLWIACTRSSCTRCHLYCRDVFKMNDIMLNRKIKSWLITTVIMRLLCEHITEANKPLAICNMFSEISPPSRCFWMTSLGI